MHCCICNTTENLVTGVRTYKVNNGVLRKTDFTPDARIICQSCYKKIVTRSRSVAAHKLEVCESCMSVLPNDHMIHNYNEARGMIQFPTNVPAPYERVLLNRAICCCCYYEALLHYMHSNSLCYDCGIRGLRIQIVRLWGKPYPYFTVTVDPLNFQTIGEHMFCDVCAPRWQTCHICGRLTTKTNIFGEYGCGSCVGVARDYVQVYNYKPKTFICYGSTATDLADIYTRDKTRYFGTELEIHVGTDVDRDIVAGLVEYEMGKYLPDDARKALYYYKHDGSVRPGFEIVTMPMTRDFITQNQELLHTLFKSIRKVVPNVDRFVSEHPNCGFHIHVSRDSMTKLHVFRLASFVFANVPNLCLVGRRTTNQYCDSKIAYPLTMQSLKPLKMHDERYKILNLQNEETIEFRFPKGLTDLNTFLYTLEFCDSMIDYTQHISNSDVSFRRYLDFVYDRKRDYPNLIPVLSNLDAKKSFQECVPHPNATRKKRVSIFNIERNFFEDPFGHDNPREVEPDYDIDPEPDYGDDGELDY